MIALRQKCVAQGSEDARLVAAEVIREDQVERRPRLRFVVVVPVGAVPPPAVGHLLGRQAKQKEVLVAGFLRSSIP